MNAQVVHEAEHTRQHARYKIPADLVVDKQSFEVKNWSVSGLSVKLSDEFSNRDLLAARLVFDFNEISTALDVELEKVQQNSETNSIGYRFINLKKSHLAVLHHLINAYLNGDIIDAGEVIEIVKRDAFSQAKQKNDSRSGEKQKTFFFRARQFVGTLIMLMVLTSLLMFIGHNIYRRVFIIDSVAASVNAPIVVVRASRASYYQSLIDTSQDTEFKKGQLIATLSLINGGAANVHSPCDCKVIDYHIRFRQFVEEGEPLLTMLPLSDGDLFVEAKFQFKDIDKLALNQSAQIKFVDGSRVMGKVYKIVSGEKITMNHVNPLRSMSTNPVSYANVLIKPVQSIDVNLLGSVASVSIDSFKNKEN